MLISRGITHRREVERIFACPVRFRGRAARPRPGSRLYTAGTTPGLYAAGPGNTQCLGGPLTGQSRVTGGPTCTGDARVSLCVVLSGPVACLSFGFVDADPSGSRCRRSCQSVEPANTSLLTAARAGSQGLSEGVLIRLS